MARVRVIATILATLMSPALAHADDDAAPPPPSPAERRADGFRLSAFFDDLETPPLPRPFVMPELSHAANEVSLDWTLATAIPENEARASRQIGLVRPTYETRIGSLRRFYFGLTVPVVIAAPEEQGHPTKTVLGNVEAHARLVFPTPAWLAFGSSLGIVAPTGFWGAGEDATAAGRAGLMLEPTELPQFVPHAIAFRPSFDIRLLTGPLVVQVRDGFDFLVDASGETHATTSGRLAAHVGVLAQKRLEVAVEATQLYLFSGDVKDGDRTTITVGPSVRWTVYQMDLGVQTSTNIYAPIESGTSRFWAFRLSAVFHL